MPGKKQYAPSGGGKKALGASHELVEGPLIKEVAPQPSRP